jgi:hypothetical protein
VSQNVGDCLTSIRFSGEFIGASVEAGYLKAIMNGWHHECSSAKSGW